MQALRGALRRGASRCLRLSVAPEGMIRDLVPAAWMQCRCKRSMPRWEERIPKWAKQFTNIKGVQGEVWRKKRVGDRHKAQSPYTIKNARYYRKQQYLAFIKQLQSEQQKEKQRREEIERATIFQGPDSKPIKPNPDVSAVVPRDPDAPTTVVRKLNHWKPKFLPPFKKPRQEYQIGRARQQSKALLKGVRRDKEVSKFLEQQRAMENSGKKKRKRIMQKTKIEYT